jgi:hypothetical protein
MNDIEPTQAASPSPSKPQPQPLGFVASVVLILVCLFGARATVTALGFTGFRMFEDGAIWWQVLVYFGTAVLYYTLAKLVISAVRARAAG